MSISVRPTEVVELFTQRFQYRPESVWRAPGRVNLIGEHTDYNGGHVLPCALDLSTEVALASNRSDMVRIVSQRFPAETVAFALKDAAAHARTPHWSRYVSAVVAALQDHGHQVGGCDLAITSTVPDGAGLSSSAALEVALSSSISHRFSLSLGLDDIAKIGQYAENRFVDCQCGIMDQLASASASHKHALLLACKSLKTRPIPLPTSHDIFVIHSGIRRGLVDSEYNQRRVECEAAARALGVSHLCDASMASLERIRTSLSEVVFRRARHVISEDQRCLKMARMLEEKRTDELESLMLQSHESLRDDFEVSVPAIDLLVDRLAHLLGSDGGVRMTGGGFGGCIVVLAPTDVEQTIRSDVLPWYHSATGHQPTLWHVQSADGVSQLEII